MRVLLLVFLLHVSCFKSGDQPGPSGQKSNMRLAVCLKRESEKLTLKSLSDVAQAGYQVSVTCQARIEEVIPYIQAIEPGLSVSGLDEES